MISKLSISTVPELQERHIESFRKYYLPLHIKLWQGAIVWSGLLSAFPAWAAQKPVHPLPANQASAPPHSVVANDTFIPQAVNHVDSIELPPQPVSQSPHPIFHSEETLTKVNSIEHSLELPKPEWSETTSTQKVERSSAELPKPEWSETPTAQKAEGLSTSRLPSSTYGAAALTPLQPLELTTVSERPLAETGLADLNDKSLVQNSYNDDNNSTLEEQVLSTQQLQKRSLASESKSIVGQAQSPCQNPDSELGCLRVEPLPQLSQPSINQSSCQNSDPELGCIRAQPISPPQLAPSANQPGCANSDPELGCIRVKPIPPQSPPVARQPVVYLIGRLDYFRSSNVFSGLDPIEDGLIRPGLTLFTAPALGPNTYFVGSIDGNLVRYSSRTEINYNELRFRAGIFQRLSPTMFAEIGWTNQQLFVSGDKIPGLASGTRFLNDHAIRFELSRRDQLARKLSLNTFYQLYASFANPNDRSRVINSVIASLNYDIRPNLQAGLDYQFALADFTQQDRVDHYNQIVARLTYTAFRNTQLSLFGGYSFGSSSDSTIDFDGSIFGVSLTVNFGLF